jgi:hypothetical protein
LAQAGIGRGGTYPYPDGYNSPVQPYAPGTAFLTGYLVPQRTAGSFQVLRDADASALAARLDTIAGVNRFDAGELEYGFSKGGQPYRGGGVCITEEITAPATKNWHVWRLLLFEAPEGREQEAAGVLVHMAETFRIDQQWAAAQAQTTAQQSRILADEQSATSKSISDGYWGRQAALDDIEARSSARCPVGAVITLKARPGPAAGAFGATALRRSERTGDGRERWRGAPAAGS